MSRVAGVGRGPSPQYPSQYPSRESRILVAAGVGRAAPSRLGRSARLGVLRLSKPEKPPRPFRPKPPHPRNDPSRALIRYRSFHILSGFCSEQLATRANLAAVTRTLVAASRYGAQIYLRTRTAGTGSPDPAQAVKSRQGRVAGRPSETGRYPSGPRVSASRASGAPSRTWSRPRPGPNSTQKFDSERPRHGPRGLGGPEITPGLTSADSEFDSSRLKPYIGPRSPERGPGHWQPGRPPVSRATVARRSRSPVNLTEVPSGQGLRLSL